MNDNDQEEQAVTGLEIQPFSTPDLGEEPEPAKGKRKHAQKPVTETTKTVRNLTQRVVVANDAKGGGIHLFPRVDVEVPTDLIGEELKNLARLRVVSIT